MATLTSHAALCSTTLLHNVSWEQYESFLTWLGNRPSVRVNYDRGSMEIMAPEFRHDREKSLIGRLIERLCEELDQPSISAGSVTLKNRLAEKGIEPDECYWLAHEPQMRFKRDLDLSIDPPPDLAVEVENTATVLKRLPIYAGIGVPEIWRWVDQSFHVLILGIDGEYHPAETSRALPMLPMDTFSHFVNRCYDTEELVLVKEFVAWVRDGMLPLV